MAAGRRRPQPGASRRGWAGATPFEQRVASVDNPALLDRALAGSVAVINCAGPFARTAAPIIDAALRAGIPYLDVAAEIEANLDSFADYGERAREADVTVLPAMAFFGGLGDLLTTAAIGDWPGADRLSIAYGLSSWRPTAGTRAAGQVSRERRGGRRIVFSNGQLELRDGAAPIVDWTFPAPFGSQKAVAEFTMADTVTDRASHRGARNRIIYEPLGRRRPRRPGNPSASGRYGRAFRPELCRRDCRPSERFATPRDRPRAGHLRGFGATGGRGGGPPSV